MKILVVGGTRYFGIPMVNALLAKCQVMTDAEQGLTEVDVENALKILSGEDR